MICNICQSAVAEIDIRDWVNGEAAGDPPAEDERYEGEEHGGVWPPAEMGGSGRQEIDEEQHCRR